MKTNNRLEMGIFIEILAEMYRTRGRMTTVEPGQSPFHPTRYLYNFSVSNGAQSVEFSVLNLNPKRVEAFTGDVRRRFAKTEDGIAALFEWVDGMNTGGNDNG